MTDEIGGSNVEAVRSSEDYYTHYGIEAAEAGPLNLETNQECKELDHG